MVYEFTRNGERNKLNEKSATPSNVSKLFKVSLDSLMLLCDGDLIMVDGNVFDPPLKDGAVYEVKGDDAAILVTTPGVAASSSHQVQKRQTNALISTEEQFLDVIMCVSETTQPMNDNVSLLYDGPNAVAVVNSIAILAAAINNFSLISSIMPREEFKRIKTPGSFKASLYQVSTSMCNAFLKADNSMGTIRACLIDMPEEIQEALQGIAMGIDEKGLKRVVKRMDDASTKCKKAAEEAKNTFNEVLHDLQELILGATAAKAANETDFSDAIKNLEIIKLKQEQQNLAIAEQEESHQENIKLVKEAAENFKKASKPIDINDLIGLTLVDMAKESIHNLTSLPGNTVSFAAQTVGKLPGLKKFVSNDPEHASNKMDLDVVYLDEIDDVLSDIHSTDNLNTKIVNDWVERLEVIKGSSKIKDVIIKMKNLRNHLQSLKKNPEQIESDKKIALLAKELSKLITAAREHLEKSENQNIEREKARLSLAETLVKEHTKFQDNALSRLDKEEDRKDKNMEAMRQSKRELAELMANMKNLDLTKNEMDGVIKCLEEGLTYLGNVQRHWTNLVQFFETINLVVANNLSNSIDKFTEGVKDGTAVEFLIKPALVASGLCVQVCNCASVYKDISQEFVTPVISAIAGNMNLPQEVARAKKNQLEWEHSETNNKVRQRIDEKMDKYSNHFQDKIQNLQKRFFRAITE